MENDSIRASGSNTLVDIWVEGRIRAISVSQEAIGAFLRVERTTGMSEKDRCEFVRTHLPLIVTAAKARVRDLRPETQEVTLESGHLPRADGGSGDRRRRQRRKGDRRKTASVVAKQPERRRGDRRKAERRARPPKRTPD